MVNIILDCDNTFGMPGRPVDDGLALLYLLGKPTVRLLGITTTHGNASAEAVCHNTKKMMGELGRNDVPVLRGGHAEQTVHDRPSEAARFLVRQAREYEGALTLVAVGALTNLWEAYRLKPRFFHYFKEIVLMGGVTEPLRIGGVQMNELNFSSDPEASFHVLTKGRRISVATGNNCLAAWMEHEDFAARLLRGSAPTGQYICEKTRSWFETKIRRYGVDGFYNWDAFAAVFAVEKHFFVDHPHRLHITEDALKNGYIGGTEEPCNCQINLPALQDPAAFSEELFESWRRVPFRR